MGCYINVLEALKKGISDCVTLELIQGINTTAMIYLDPKYQLSINDDKDIEAIREILEISNILYNNTDRDILPLDDGVYDLLLELYKKFNPQFQVGAMPIAFAPTQNENNNKQQELKTVYRVLDRDRIKDFLYTEELLNMPDVTSKDILKTVYRRIGEDVYISKRNVNIKHNYPKLVGSLDKCKFVLNQDAIEKGVFEDTNCLVFERDFIGKHIASGLIQPQRRIKGRASIKYDGVSIEADVTNMVIGARTRGDANEDIAADLTPIFYGYKFPHAPEELWNQEAVGLKFECIMTRPNLNTFNKLRGKEYKNCRTAIIGLLALSDAYKYRDLITLVPLATSLENISREEEIAFMNKYYQTGIYFMSMYFEGDYVSVLYQIKKFVEEAEYMRDFLPFMYDGIVVEYTDEDLIRSLGRVNAINKYSIAIKFTPLKRLTTFRGYEYTIGQYGTITPMIYYDPIEFFGSIHNHSSGHSYDRFKTLQLRIGDIVEVEYSHDVMPYVTKPDNSHNQSNTNPIVPFITHCPCCGTLLLESNSGKNIYCPNIACDARNLKRMVNMIKKLNLKDFAEARLEDIGAKSLQELFNLTYKDLEFLGDIMANKLLDRINDLKTKPIKDYDIIGTLGFESVGRRKFKLLLAKYTLSEILYMDALNLKQCIINIKGLGPSAADTIISQMEFFIDDLRLVLSMNNIIYTKGQTGGKIVRFSGFRDRELVESLQTIGVDADDSASISMKTDILLVPYLVDVDGQEYTSTKVVKVNQYNQKGANIQIVGVEDFMDDFYKYL